MRRFKSVLACDVGNSRIALGSVVDEKVTYRRDVPVDQLDKLSEILEEVFDKCEQPIIAACSVQPEYFKLLESAVKEKLNQEVLLVGRDLPLPMKTALAEPERIVTDRLCSAAMAYHRLGGACVVADFGTAITIDCVDDEGTFLGGAILPGLRMSADALASGTALLPKVQLEKPDWIIGTDTRRAIIAGVISAARGALRWLTEAYATELGHWPEVIVTGGDAELVVADLQDVVHAVVPDLCLMGVALAAIKGSETPSENTSNNEE